MIARILMLGIITCILSLLLVTRSHAGSDPLPWLPPQEQKFQGHTAEWWAHRATFWKHRSLMLRRRWRPTVNYALKLASVVSGVPYSQLWSVSWCESTHDPFATNGRYGGLFQLGWSPFGFSKFDPVANALSAALTVRNDGSWRQWACKP